jgi:hypothetical protein
MMNQLRNASPNGPNPSPTGEVFDQKIASFAPKRGNPSPILHRGLVKDFKRCNYWRTLNIKKSSLSNIESFTIPPARDAHIREGGGAGFIRPIDALVTLRRSSRHVGPRSPITRGAERPCDAPKGDATWRHLAQMVPSPAFTPRTASGIVGKILFVCCGGEHRRS